MPLTFDTISHGAIAFGFFNIESDMLLLEAFRIGALKVSFRRFICVSPPGDSCRRP